MSQKPAKKPRISAEKVLEAIRQISPDNVCTDPDWKTARQWAAEWGVSGRATREYLRRGLAAGMIEYEDRKKMCGMLARRVPCYRAVARE